MNYQIEDKIRFLTRAFGRVERSRDGKNVAVSCPQCKDSSKRKLAIRLDDDRVNCWVCHLHGRVISVLRRFKSNLVHEYIEKFGNGMIDVFFEEEEKHAEMPENFRLLAPRKKDRTLRWAWAYVKRRGLTERDLWYFKMGVSTEKRFYRRLIMLSLSLSRYPGVIVQGYCMRRV